MLLERARAVADGRARPRSVSVRRAREQTLGHHDAAIAFFEQALAHHRAGAQARHRAARPRPQPTRPPDGRARRWTRSCAAAPLQDASLVRVVATLSDRQRVAVPAPGARRPLRAVVARARVVRRRSGRRRAGVRRAAAPQGDRGRGAERRARRAARPRRPGAARAAGVPARGALRPGHAHAWPATRAPRELGDERDQLERELAREIPELAQAQRLRQVDHRALAAALPEGAALVEIVTTAVFDFDALPPSWSGYRYLAFVLRRDGVRLVDLGDEAVDGLVEDYLAPLSRRGAAARHIGVVARRAVSGPDGSDLRALRVRPARPAAARLHLARTGRSRGCRSSRSRACSTTSRSAT